MATLVSKYTEIGFTILPHTLDSELQQELFKYPGRNVIGYVTYNKTCGEYNFVNTNGENTESHWSLDIIKNSTYSEWIDTWIVFNCPPQKTRVAFQQILCGEKILVDQWDTWAVEGVDAKVAIITSWEFA